MRRFRQRTTLSQPGVGLLGLLGAAPSGVELKGSILGKHIMVTRDDRTCTMAELRQHLARFNLSWMLRRVGEMAVECEGQSAMSVSAQVVPVYCLPYLALVALEEAHDDVQAIPSRADLAEAAVIYNALREPDFSSGGDDDRVFEFLIRLGYAQFSGHGDLRNSIARTWTLYQHTWPRTAVARRFDINAAIRKETGLNLRQLMMFGFAYSGHSQSGYMTPYDDQALTKLPNGLHAGPPEQARFLEWVTATYDELRQMGAANIPDEGYDKYRLNPLLVKPVVRPDKPPAPGGETIRLVPVPRYLVRRVTDGLYHALATAND